MQDKVKQFHKAMGLPISNSHEVLDYDVALTRIGLIGEELAELTYAFASRDIVKQVDALADLLYVVFGTGVAMGVDLEPCFDEVHRSNMTKVGGKINSAGKLEKPKHYTPPELDTVLIKQMARGHYLRDKLLHLRRKKNTDGKRKPPTRKSTR